MLSRYLLFFSLVFMLSENNSYGQKTRLKRSDIASVSINGDSVPVCDKGLVCRITISGNRTTKDFIILRELTFSAGDTIIYSDSAKQFNQSEKNLLNTSLFNFVTVTYKLLNETFDPVDSLEIRIDVKERWYTWPAPIFDVMEPNLNTWWRNGHNLDRASYGAMITRYNFRGRRETLAAIARFGYSQQFGGQYSIPFINRKKTLGITVTGLYTRNHEVFYATRANQLIYYKDEDHRIRKEVSASAKLSYRRGIYQRNTLEVKYTDLSVFDTVVDLEPDYFAAQSDRMRYFTLSYQFVRDKRDAKAYPLHGHLFDFEVTRHGLGIFPDENLSVTFIAASVRKWFQFGKSRIFGGAMVRGRILTGPVPPYYHQRALGFSTYVRGFEYYVIDGQNYVVAKSAFRYQLLKPRIFKFKWFPMEKFNTLHLALYAGLFADAGYVQDKASTVQDNNVLGNSWLSGYGAGFDIVTYYDLTFRFEYTFNNLAEGGFYVHFGAPF
jgi:outer membrane protein assembly factor BamA